MELKLGLTGGSSAYAFLAEPTPRTKVSMALLIYAYVAIVVGLALFSAMNPEHAPMCSYGILGATVITFLYGYVATARSIARLKASRSV